MSRPSLLLAVTLLAVNLLVLAPVAAHADWASSKWRPGAGRFCGPAKPMALALTSERRRPGGVPPISKGPHN